MRVRPRASKQLPPPAAPAPREPPALSAAFSAPEFGVNSHDKLWVDLPNMSEQVHSLPTVSIHAVIHQGTSHPRYVRDLFPLRRGSSSRTSGVPKGGRTARDRVSRLNGIRGLGTPKQWQPLVFPGSGGSPLALCPPSSRRHQHVGRCFPPADRLQPPAPVALAPPDSSSLGLQPAPSAPRRSPPNWAGGAPGWPQLSLAEATMELMAKAPSA